MSWEELRELDAWIAEHVMGWKSYANAGTWHPTSDPSAAIEVLKKCMELFQGRGNVLQIAKLSDGQFLVQARNGDQFTETNLSLETALCLFAKQLFSK